MGFSRFVSLCSLPLLLLSACQAETVTQTEQAIPTNTLAPPTATTQPIVTEVPTVTPYLPLSSERPYLLYMVTGDTWDETFFYLMDMEGFGRKRIALPENSRVFRPLEKSISPDGRWLVFHTPGNGSPWHMNLHMFNLETEEDMLITPLLSQDFPENQKEVADALIELGVQEEARGFIEFGSGINHALSWSPDGHILAFSAQIDGPSTDIYLYDVDTGETRRLTNDLFNIWTLDWSPDGEWITYQGVVMGVNYQGSTLEAINVATKEIRKFRGIREAFFWAGVDWISNSEYLTRGSPDGGDPHNLQIANMSTGQYSTLWEETYFTLSIDRENALVQIFGVPGRTLLEAGFFLVSYDGKRTFITNGKGPWLHYFRGSQRTRFVGLFDEGVYGVTLDGTTHLITQANKSVYISPDYRWMVVGKEDGFELYDKNNQLVNTFSGLVLPEQYLQQLIWRPDGDGFIVRANEMIYYVSIPDVEVTFIEDCPTSECWMISGNSAWLP